MKPKNVRGRKTTMMSFRFSKETTSKLEKLCSYYGRTKTEFLEDAIDEYHRKLPKKRS